MKTEKRNVYVVASKFLSGVSNNHIPELELQLYPPKSTPQFAKALIQQLQVEIPVLTDKEMDIVLSGAELDSLVKARDIMRAEFQEQLASIEDRISKLKCIESKGGNND